MHRVERKARAIVASVNDGELKAIRYILSHVVNHDVLRLSDVCSKTDIERNQFVIALKGLIASEILDRKSLGRNGTYIKILDRETTTFIASHADSYFRL